MNKKLLITGISLMSLLAIGCGNNTQKSEQTKDKTKVEEEISYMNITINPNEKSPFNKGEFEGFGTSFCWWANRIGYSDELSSKAAELFYNKEKGIGLNIIRYNIGGGDDPSHNHIKRTDSMVPGYLELDPITNEEFYNWDADYNQRNVLQKAISENKEEIIVEAFSNSAPYFMTVSGCSSGGEDPNKNNLKDDKYDDFANYIANVAKQFKDEWGVNFQSISPMNEPFTNYWGAFSDKQEGCHFDQGESQSKMLIEMDKALKNKGLNDILVVGTDETSIDTQITSFNALSNEAKEVIDRIDTHSYGGDKRAQLKLLAVNNDKNLWMSEVDGGDTLGEGAGEMGAALWLADRIITDLNDLKASAWILWQVIDSHISKEGYMGNKDTGMVNKAGGHWGTAVANHDSKTIILTKKYYAFGQFSKYIRPGFTIIDADNDTLAAFDKVNNQLVIVSINKSSKEKPVKYDLSKFESVEGPAKHIRTSGSVLSGENLEEVEPINIKDKVMQLNLKPNSISTFIIENVTK